MPNTYTAEQLRRYLADLRAVYAETPLIPYLHESVKVHLKNAEDALDAGDLALADGFRRAAAACLFQDRKMGPLEVEIAELAWSLLMALAGERGHYLDWAEYHLRRAGRAGLPRKVFDNFARELENFRNGRK